MTEIPADIKQAGRLEAEFYAKWLHAGNSKGSLSPHAIDGLADSFARLIHSERLRNAEIMEQVRKVLEPFSQEATVYDPDTSDNDDLVWATPAYFRIKHLRAARALLSKLEKL
jgi:hypothetical protein